jgi:membrane-bound serine protease (ClpP class)
MPDLLFIDWWVIPPAVVLVVSFVAFAVFKTVGTYRHQATTGREDLKGKTANVRLALDPEGTVFYEGELWRAVSESGHIDAGEEVIITSIKGLKLTVIKKRKE